MRQVTATTTLVLNQKVDPCGVPLMMQTRRVLAPFKQSPRTPSLHWEGEDLQVAVSREQENQEMRVSVNARLHEDHQTSQIHRK